MTARDEAFARVRKLLERAKSDTGPEARAARRLARELMQKYGLTYTEPKPTKKPAVATKVSSPPAATSTPVIITVKLGGMRIRWKL